MTERVGSDRGWKKLQFELEALRKLTDLSIGAGREQQGWKKLGFQLKSFRKPTDLSVVAGRERPGMEKALISIEIL